MTGLTPYFIKNVGILWGRNNEACIENPKDLNKTYITLILKKTNLNTIGTSDP